VIVEGDPLRDIGATKNVRTVIKSGVGRHPLRPEVGQPDSAAAVGTLSMSWVDLEQPLDSLRPILTEGLRPSDSPTRSLELVSRTPTGSGRRVPSDRSA
jgi:hypothetical protein